MKIQALNGRFSTNAKCTSIGDLVTLFLNLKYRKWGPKISIWSPWFRTHTRAQKGTLPPSKVEVWNHTPIHTALDVCIMVFAGTSTLLQKKIVVEMKPKITQTDMYDIPTKYLSEIAKLDCVTLFPHQISHIKLYHALD